MKENPYLAIGAYRLLTGDREQRNKWHMEIYIPEMLKTGQAKGIDRYQTAIETLDYPQTFTLIHWDRFGDWNGFSKSSFGADYCKHLNARVAAGNIAPIWFAIYQLVRGFRNDGEPLWANADKGAENTPVMLLEGYSLTPQQERDYGHWLARDGCHVFVPLLLKLPGLMEYGYYRILDERMPPEVPQPEEFSVHPKWLSILHFENIKAFEDYEDSLELAAMKSALKAPFPGGLEYQWYAQYRLLGSWRK